MYPQCKLARRTFGACPVAFGSRPRNEISLAYDEAAIKQTARDPVTDARLIVLHSIAVKCHEPHPIRELTGVSERCLVWKIVVGLIFGLIGIAYLFWPVLAP